MLSQNLFYNYGDAPLFGSQIPENNLLLERNKDPIPIIIEQEEKLSHSSDTVHWPQDPYHPSFHVGKIRGHTKQHIDEHPILLANPHALLNSEVDERKPDILFKRPEPVPSAPEHYPANSIYYSHIFNVHNDGLRKGMESQQPSAIQRRSDLLNKIRQQKEIINSFVEEGEYMKAYELDKAIETELMAADPELFQAYLSEKQDRLAQRQRVLEAERRGQVYYAKKLSSEALDRSAIDEKERRDQEIEDLFGDVSVADLSALLMQQPGFVEFGPTTVPEVTGQEPADLPASPNLSPIVPRSPTGEEKTSEEKIPELDYDIQLGNEIVDLRAVDPSTLRDSQLLEAVGRLYATNNQLEQLAVGRENETDILRQSEELEALADAFIDRLSRKQLFSKKWNNLFAKAFPNPTVRDNVRNFIMQRLRL